MPKKIIFISILITLILVITISSAIFYFQIRDKNMLAKEQKRLEAVAEQIIKDKEKKSAELVNNYNQQFPDVIEGVVDIISDEKTTVRTDNGVEYLITPPRPLSFYEGMGIEDNTQVEVRGKILENNQIHLGSITPID